MDPAKKPAVKEQAAAVPFRLRVGLAVLLPANIALLVYSHVCAGATVVVNGIAQFGPFGVHATSADSNMGTAIKNISAQGAWFTILLIGILSGLWPYLKLIGTALVVFLNGTSFDSKRRACEILLWLEVFGKYSFAAVLLVCVALPAANVSTGKYTIMMMGTLEAKVWLQLHFGVLGFAVAIIASTILTHWAALEMSSMPLLSAIARPGEHSPLVLGKQPARTFARWGVAAGMAAAAAGSLLLVGASLPMTVVDRGGGFLGKLLKSTETLELSTFSMASRLWGADGGGIVEFFFFCFVALTLVVPLLELALLCYAGAAVGWCGHSSYGQGGAAHSCRALARCLSSFSCVEVLLLVVLALVFELPKIAQGSLREECEPLKGIMDDFFVLSMAGIGFAASSECFSPTARLRAGWWVLLASVALRLVAWRWIGAEEDSGETAKEPETPSAKAV